MVDEATSFLYCFSAIFNPLVTLWAKDDYRKVIRRFIRRISSRCGGGGGGAGGGGGGGGGGRMVV